LVFTGLGGSLIRGRAPFCADSSQNGVIFRNFRISRYCPKGNKFRDYAEKVRLQAQINDKAAGKLAGGLILF
jgi:hypothetical protein